MSRAYHILRKYPNDVRLIFKQFPLEHHTQARFAAEASLAAHAQGKFWEMHDKLFANQRDLSRARILLWAKELGLDMARFQADLGASRLRAVVDREIAEGETAGVEGTPTFFLNGQRYNGSVEPEAFEPVIEAELKKLAASK